MGASRVIFTVGVDDVVTEYAGGGTTGTDADWTEIEASEGVQSVNGKTGSAVTLAAGDVGADLAGAAASAQAKRDRSVGADSYSHRGEDGGRIPRVLATTCRLRRVRGDCGQGRDSSISCGDKR